MGKNRDSRRQQGKARTLRKIPHMAGGSIDVKKDVKDEQPSELLQKELGMTPEEIAKMAEGFKAGVEEAEKDKDSVILTDINSGIKYRADKDALLIESVKTKAKDWILKNKGSLTSFRKELSDFRKELSDDEYDIERKESLFRSVLNEMGIRNSSNKNNNKSEQVTKLAAATFEDHCKLNPEIQKLINAKFKNVADRQKVISEIHEYVYARILKSGRIKNPDVITNMNVYLTHCLKDDANGISETMRMDKTGVCTLFYGLYMNQIVEIVPSEFFNIYYGLVASHTIKTWADAV